MNDPHPVARPARLAIPRAWRRAGLGVAACLLAATALADEPTPQATPLSLNEFFRHPVGPRGLEPGERLLALAGHRVEIAGFLVQQGSPSGVLIVAPVPVVIGDEDESFADDLPANVAYLHPADARTAELLQACRGALRVRGRIDIGRQAEDDGRQSFVRLQADAARCAPAAPR